MSKKKKNQNRSKFTGGDLKRLRASIEAEEGGGPRAQQRVLTRLREAGERMEVANSGLQRSRLRKRLGL